MSLTPVLLAALLAGEVDAQGVTGLLAVRRGHVVVVSFWATWCAPCLEEFPDLAKIAAARREVEFVSISIDDLADRPAVESFVAEQRPPFPVYLKAAGDDQAFIDGVDREWSGVVPTTFVYRRDGTRAALLQGEQPRTTLERAIEGAMR